MRTQLSTAFFCCTLCSIWATNPVFAGLVIDIQARSSLASNPQALAAFETAADRWEMLFDDNVTVRIDADLRMLSSGILGQAGSTLFGATYTNTRTAMINDGAGYADNAILNALPTTIQYKTLAGVNTNSTAIGMTRANAKALGLVDAQSALIDATIAFNNTGYIYDFNPDDGITPGAYDFVAIAAHEIGHALGFISAVDDIDEGDTNVFASTLDLFRFENGTINDPSTLADFSTTIRSLQPGVDAIFDDLQNEWRMATGVNMGDGRQASHWKDMNPSIGLMDPTLSAGQLGVITEADIRSLDLIGWNRVAAVPEPAALTWASAGLILLFRRRMKQSTR